MTVYEHALAVLTAQTPKQKCTAAQALKDSWNTQPALGQTPQHVPDSPGRPERPELVPPNEVPRRRLGSSHGRAALLHAVAHIELNAIDLAADMIARFAHHSDISNDDRASFITDWITVCHDEARHFGLLQERMAALGVSYGDFPAHNGLWEAALSTKDDFAARLAIAPMVLEARGLDVTPNMIEKLTKVGDIESAKILKTIYNDEISHVATGARWFQTLANHYGKDPESFFHQLVTQYFAGQLKPPFNVQARTLAGLKEGYYMPLT